MDRTNSYIAVMIDDLTLQGVTEPYRMLTARAEYRLRLRSDNAHTRLTPLAIEAGAVGMDRMDAFNHREQMKATALDMMSAHISADALMKQGVPVKPDAGKMSKLEWLRFPHVSIMDLLEADRAEWSRELLLEIEQDGRYAPYLARQEAEIQDIAANEKITLASNVDYAAIAGLSNEMVEKLQSAKPENLAAASRLRGITPAALAAILVHAKRARSAVTEAA
jgi:tRNA uridine 5-carboxymethylaminomethyl modification enzyme